MSRALDVLGNIVDEVDATVLERESFELPHGVGHNSGTTRMGTDPSASVVDRNLRTHDVANLYVASASTFVTQGANQPTLTIAALSLRLAKHLHESVL